MANIFSYSFSLTPPKPKLHEYAYGEFELSLPLHWKQIPNSEQYTVNFHSDELNAGITISADFYAIPEDKALLLAEKNVASRIEALEKTSAKLEVFHKTIKPHSGGVGLEMSLAAEVPGEYVYIYLGYVTSRKILNFTLVCKPNRQAASELFNEIVPNFRPLLP